jgi:RHS repeat-associated protein
LLLVECSSDGTAHTYGYLPGTSTPLFLKQDDTYYWYRTDRLGIPHKLVASNGNVVWSGAYDAFGNCEVGVETVESHLRLPGQYYDAETGLYYNLNRYYDPKIGRYLQPDPAGDGLNPYVYVGANPVNAIDPEGLCALRMFSGIAEVGVGYGLVNSGVFLAPGTLMMINGMDEAVAGFRGLWTGQPSRSVLEHAMYSTIPNETVASSVHFASQLAISAGPGLKPLGHLIDDFMTTNRHAAYIYGRSLEMMSPIIPRTVRFDPDLYKSYLNANSILLGRFYQSPLRVFRKQYAPGATILSGRIGLGKHLVRNIQRVIDRTPKIFLRAEAALDPLSFTYRHELQYILKNKQLIQKTTALLEDGTALPLADWAKAQGLKF